MRSFVKRLGLETLIAICRILQMHRGKGAAFVFHALGPASPVSIEEAEFWQKVRYLRSMGFRGASVTEGIQELGHTGRYTVFTFDDAYENITRALLRLTALGWSATVYVPTGWIGAHNGWDSEKPTIPRMAIMDAKRIKELQARGIEFGAHTVYHPRLDELHPEELQKEVSQSKQQLEAVTDLRVRSFAFPYGMASSEAVEATSFACFSSALTTRPVYWRPRQTRLLGRFPGHVDFDLFRLIVHGGYDLYRVLGRLFGRLLLSTLRNPG